MVLALVLVAAPAPAGVTRSDVAGWLASSPQIVPSHLRDRLPAELHWQVELRSDPDVSGFVSPELASNERLANGQRVMILPLVSGGSGGVFYTLLFTKISGKTRFVGYVPSQNGHLDVTVDRGTLLIRTPVYGTGNGGNCCPSDFDFERATLHGIRLIVLKRWTVAVRR